MHVPRTVRISCVSFKLAASYLLDTLRMSTQEPNLKPLTWGDAFEEATKPQGPSLTPAELCAALLNNLRTAVRESSPLTWADVF